MSKLKTDTQLPQAIVSSCVFGDSETEILKLEDESIDIICIDPPYLYLKNQKLEREFYEQKFFEECKRILTKDGFIIMFGRGISFYRWNTILAQCGFTFKEEIVWDKSQTSSPLLSLSRVHETVTIFTKGKGIINKCRVPYLESKNHDMDSVISDVKRLKNSFSNVKVLSFIEDYLKNGVISTDGVLKRKGITVGSERNEDINRELGTIRIFNEGLIEKSIIRQVRNHYKSIHPTEKPVRLLERLLMLCLPNKPKNKITVVDFFAGSFSCGEACYNLGVNFKGYEIDQEYYEKGIKRMEKVKFQSKLF